MSTHENNHEVTEKYLGISSDSNCKIYICVQQYPMLHSFIYLFTISYELIFNQLLLIIIMEINVFVGLINIPYSNVSLALLHTNIFYKMPHLTGLLLFVMLVLVRGDPAFTKTEVIGLDILAPRHPKLYSLIVGRLGYDINTNTNIVSNRQGNVDESCQPDATGRQICLKVCDFL